jgi:putative DNA methylase
LKETTGSDGKHVSGNRIPGALWGLRQTLLEKALPFRELSLIAQADRRNADPVYGGHRWWARRPAGVIRGLLLAAALPATTSPTEYWRAFASEEPTLEGLRVHDLFVGGGTTLVEAARLGAIASGTDVDPLAVEIVEHELSQVDEDALSAAGADLIHFLETRIGQLFASKKSTWTPLHYFWLHRVRCPDCERESPLYRDLVLARSGGKNGSVVRDAAITAFCPSCFSVHEIGDPNRKLLMCCERRKLDEGNFSAQKFVCGFCGRRSSHRELKTGSAPRRLIAVEETSQEHYRRIRQATRTDVERTKAAETYITKHRDKLWWPSLDLSSERRDSRPLSFGILRPTQLFTSRQLAVFGHAFSWLADACYPAPIMRALKLALSNCLSTNNRLCGYATDYGRLAPLFSVRGYSLPALPVELNPFHPTAGRGTLYKGVQKVVRSTRRTVKKYVWSENLNKPISQTMLFEREASAKVICASAEAELPVSIFDVDICLFDPPYFDYIAYSELSEFHRCWIDRRELGGVPLLPDDTDPVNSFASRLSSCLTSILGRLKAGRPVIFTFHSTAPEAWRAIGLALDNNGLMVTALWPLRNDSHMGHHSAAGNCEWDLAICCRQSSDCTATAAEHTVEQWREQVTPLKISDADRSSMDLGIQIAKQRFGALRNHQERSR